MIKNSLKKLIEPISKDSKQKQVNGTTNKLEIDESLFNLDDLADIQDEIEELNI